MLFILGRGSFSLFHHIPEACSAGGAHARPAGSVCALRGAAVRLNPRATEVRRRGWGPAFAPHAHGAQGAPQPAAPALPTALSPPGPPARRGCGRTAQARGCVAARGLLSRPPPALLLLRGTFGVTWGFEAD